MHRRPLLALLLPLPLLFACSLFDRAPVLQVELGPVSGATLDAGALENARGLLQKRLAAASVGNARVTVVASRLLVELDKNGAEAWPEIKAAILAQGELSFLPVATDAPFLAELMIETQRAGISEKRNAYDPPPAASVSFAASDRDLATLQSDVRRLVAVVTGGDERWLVAVDGSGEKDCRECVILLDRRAGMERVAITNARPETTEWGTNVQISLSNADAKRFEDLTASLVKRKLAIVLDGVVMSTPVVQEKIAGGNVQITTGSKSRAAGQREAKALAAALASGSLPAAFDVTSERTIAP